MKQTLYTAQEAADLLNVTRASVYNYLKEKRITSQQMSDGTHVFTEEDINKFKQKKQEATRNRKQEKLDNRIDNTLTYFNEPENRESNPLTSRQAKTWLIKFIQQKKITIKKYDNEKPTS